MRILIISPTQSGIGGIARVVQNQKKFLISNGYDVDIISSENTPIIPIKGLKNLSFMITSFLKTKFKNNYDIIHAHNPASGMAMMSLTGKKVLSIWGNFEEQISLLHGNFLGKIAGNFQENIIKNSDAVIVASKKIQTEYNKLGYNTHYMPNGIDFDELPKSKERIYQKQIIFIGRLSKEKGILELLDAAKKIPENIHLLIVGNGPEQSKVENISKLSTNIHYLGYLPNERVIKLIRGSDILIQPSLIEGGLNSTLLEAMACKTPILIKYIPEYGDEIEHLKTAYVIQTNSSDNIVNGIDELINNFELREEIANEAYKISLNHSWNNLGEQLVILYKKLLSVN